MKIFSFLKTKATAPETKSAPSAERESGAITPASLIQMLVFAAILGIVVIAQQPEEPAAAPQAAAENSLPANPFTEEELATPQAISGGIGGYIKDFLRRIGRFLTKPRPIRPAPGLSPEVPTNPKECSGRKSDGTREKYYCGQTSRDVTFCGGCVKDSGGNFDCHVNSQKYGECCKQEKCKNTGKKQYPDLEDPEHPGYVEPAS